FGIRRDVGDIGKDRGILVEHPAIALENGHVVTWIQLLELRRIEIVLLDEFQRVGLAGPLESDLAGEGAGTGKTVELHGDLLETKNVKGKKWRRTRGQSSVLPQERATRATGLQRRETGPIENEFARMARSYNIAASRVAWRIARLASSSAATSAPPITWTTTPSAISSSASVRLDSCPAQMITLSTPSVCGLPSMLMCRPASSIFS